MASAVGSACRRLVNNLTLLPRLHCMNLLNRPSRNGMNLVHFSKIQKITGEQKQLTSQSIKKKLAFSCWEDGEPARPLREEVGAPCAEGHVLAPGPVVLQDRGISPREEQTTPHHQREDTLRRLPGNWDLKQSVRGQASWRYNLRQQK